jgi:hypothetical protein
MNTASQPSNPHLLWVEHRRVKLDKHAAALGHRLAWTTTRTATRDRVERIGTCTRCGEELRVYAHRVRYGARYVRWHVGDTGWARGELRYPCNTKLALQNTGRAGKRQYRACVLVAHDGWDESGPVSVSWSGEVIVAAHSVRTAEHELRASGWLQLLADEMYDYTCGSLQDMTLIVDRVSLA